VIAFERHLVAVDLTEKVHRAGGTIGRTELDLGDDFKA